MENPIEQLKNSLKASKWSEESQKKILVVLPRLGKNNIEFLQDKVEGFETRLEAKYIALVLEEEVSMLEKLLESDTKDFITLIRSGYDRPSYDFGQYIIPFVLDVAWGIRQHKIPQSSYLLEAILEFEIKFFSALPLDEVLLLVQENIVSLAQKTSMLLLFKQYFWRNFKGYKKTFSTDLLSALERNEEKLGSENLVIEEKKYRPTVHNWIQDYIQSLPRSVSARSTFDEIQYIRTSKNVLSLREEEKTILLEIVKLHNWFLNPIVNEKEVRRYEAEQEMEKEKTVQLVNTTTAVPENMVAQQQFVDIDKKLEELKRKTGVSQ